MTELTSKKKILVLSDSPLAPSGVGTQTKNVIESLLETGRYSVICLAGAMAHKSYQPTTVEPYGKDWIIHPVDGYGSPAIVRSILANSKPDVLWFMTDPRFWVWLWDMSEEIRKNVPMVYYHVWDNYPYPKYNRDFYLSTDVVCSISKVTNDIVKNVAPEVHLEHIPHAVNTDIFKNLTESNPLEIFSIKRELEAKNKFVFFWNNRNARRKQSGTILHWFKEFLDEVGHDKATLLMHTEPSDPHGQNLDTIIEHLDLIDGQVAISNKKVSQEHLALLYNAADCTINIADAEGFGLSTLESLACETPIIVTLTGGLKEQVTDGTTWFGIGIEPSSKSIIGSQQVPYIYEDRINKENFLSALREMFHKSPKERWEIGRLGRNHVLDNYGFLDFKKKWVSLLDSVTERYGSWNTRKHYRSWEIFEL